MSDRSSQEVTQQEENRIARENIQKQLLHFGLVDILEPLRQQYKLIASGEEYNSKQTRDLATMSSAQVKVLRLGVDILRLTKN